MIQPERVKPLNNKPVGAGPYVLYWMQASQRTNYNHALEYAISQANSLDKPLVVLFGLTDSFPEANARHYVFMLEGLKEVDLALKDRGIKLVVRRDSPELAAADLASNACLVVVDFGYLKIQRGWRKYVAERIDCPLIQVESDVIVPVETSSEKEEFSAATFRPKITPLFEQYLTPVEQYNPVRASTGIDLESINIHDIDEVLSGMTIDRSVNASSRFRGGVTEAKQRLRQFLERKLDRYNDLRNDPNADAVSDMSPYLHFGQISPLEIALAVYQSGSPGSGAYLEDILVRRELSMNFIYYNSHYDEFSGIPSWAKQTLLKHQTDARPYLYSVDELEYGEVHDPFWLAAQQEMKITGKMHGYMRMYWGKKILEWSRTPEEAFKIALYLNNKYELDGRDPNGFTGVAWCFGKHDRPWGERPVFGTVRYMNENGLKRKFDAHKYVNRIKTLSESNR